MQELNASVGDAQYNVQYRAVPNGSDIEFNMTVEGLGYHEFICKDCKHSRVPHADLESKSDTGWVIKDIMDRVIDDYWKRQA